MAIHFSKNPAFGAKVPDLSGLGVVIRLKADLLCQLVTTQPSSWPEQVIRFVGALDRSDLKDTTALLVLLTELRQELGLLLGIAEHGDVGPSASNPALDLRPDLGRGDMLARFRQHVLDVLLPAAKRRRPASPVADKMKRIIDERYAEPLTLDMLAEAVGRSKRHLASAFLREFGLSVHRYLIRVRLNRALALIRAGEKIEAVSLLVGYRSKKNFYRHFNAHIGGTPIAYRTALSSLRKPPTT
jgi:AraC-like DNA-binding protein